MNIQLDNQLSNLASKDNLVLGKNVNLLSAVKSLWLHVDWGHVLDNFLLLIPIGILLELFISRTYFIGTYLVGGVLAIALNARLTPLDFHVSVGASGAIWALVGLALTCVRPFHKKRIFGVLSPGISWFIVMSLIVFHLMMNIISATMSSLLFNLDNTNHWVHVYGFGFGVVIGLLGLILKKTKLSPYLFLVRV